MLATPTNVVEIQVYGTTFNVHPWRAEIRSGESLQVRVDWSHSHGEWHKVTASDFILVDGLRVAHEPTSLEFTAGVRGDERFQINFNYKVPPASMGLRCKYKLTFEGELGTIVIDPEVDLR